MTWTSKHSIFLERGRYKRNLVSNCC